MTGDEPMDVSDLNLTRPTTEAQRLQAMNFLVQALPDLSVGRYATVAGLVHGAATIARYIAYGDLPELRPPAAETDATPAPEDAS